MVRANGVATCSCHSMQNVELCRRRLVCSGTLFICIAWAFLYLQAYLGARVLKTLPFYVLSFMALHMYGRSCSHLESGTGTSHTQYEYKSRTPRAFLIGVRQAIVVDACPFGMYNKQLYP